MYFFWPLTFLGTSWWNVFKIGKQIGIVLYIFFFLEAVDSKNSGFDTHFFLCGFDRNKYIEER